MERFRKLQTTLGTALVLAAADIDQGLMPKLL